ncbi:hypothetical protein [Thalassotalea mangrovi]|uniref:Uncharacterized protein n=1 Tax=Thalassotalea mangrovi TaxID=2572245 RepID=A0A4U1B8F8_9GAMM|nr:hypothetical protein [Thalassotalea mangrovi]TKB46305.1 hypothetical protein E8M12_04430 [Thalassotalea mangrovi]
MGFCRLVCLTFSGLLSVAVCAGEDTAKSQQELVQNFTEIHQNMMAKVAVADMLFGCKLEKQEVEASGSELQTYIVDTDRNSLAEQLMACIGEENIGSEMALNFGIIGCFSDQTRHLEQQEQQQKMTQVADAMKVISKEERQKSFTQCVNNQALQYLQVEK